MSLDDKLTAAIRVAKHHHLSYFAHALKKHRRHESFQMRDWVHTRELGFACECSGVVQEWRINIMTVKEMIPEAREAFMRFRSHMKRRGDKARKRSMSQADRKARALLHRFLTREQRQTMRGCESFTMTDKDGRTYEVSKSGTQMLVDGVPRYNLCVVSRDVLLPTYDLMLAHKVFLECDPRTFLRMAHVRDFETDRNFVSGDFLADGAKPPPVNEVCEDVPDLLSLPNEVLDDPRPWMEEQLRDE
jgi:hypothetical protein